MADQNDLAHQKNGTFYEGDLLALVNWLRSFPKIQELYCDDAIQRGGLERPDVAMGVLSVFGEVFDSPVEARESDAWQQVLRLVQKHEPEFILSWMNENCITDQARQSLLAAAICRSIKSDCYMRTTYVNRIINMDQDVQVLLQNIIEGGPVRQDQYDRKSLTVEGPMDNDQNEITENDSEIEIKYSTSSGYCRSPDEKFESTGYTPARKKRNQSTSSPLDSPYMAGSSYSEREIEELRANNEIMKGEVELSNQRESEMRSKLEEVEGKHRAASIKQETEFMNLKNELEDKYEDELSALKREVTSLQEFKQEALEAREEISMLRDELDINQHSSEKYAFAEDQLRKCKEKLEDMNDTKEALVREEEAHGALISKCLQLENELTALNPLKRQLEEYKTRAVDAEVKVTEYEEDIRTLKSQQEALVGMNEDLHLGAKLHQEVNQEMTKRLVEEANLNHVETLSAVGEGMSELNPELMEEVQRLRNENARFKEFAAKRENDSVQKMEEQLDDKARLSDKYKEQFIEKKGELENTRVLLATSMASEQELKLEIGGLNHQISEIEAQMNEERESAKESLKQAERILEETTKDLIKKAQQSQNDLENKMNSLVEDERESSKEHINCMVEEMRLLIDNHSQELDSLQLEHSSKMEKLEEDSQGKIDKLKSGYEKERSENDEKFIEEKEALVSKGKAMILELKTQAQLDLEKLREDRDVVITKMEEEMKDFREKQEGYEKKVKDKLADYKKKLKLSVSSKNELSNENEDLKDHNEKMEREKIALQAENERFRRQLGGHFGADNKAQSQYEELRGEYESVLAENMQLREDLAGREQPLSFADNRGGISIDPSTLQYAAGRANKSGSALAQVSAEYEETIERLTNEKRELVMRHSAALTDVQKADQRSWDLEEEVTRLKNELISIQLEIQRTEKQKSDLSAFSPQWLREHNSTAIESPVDHKPKSAFFKSPTGIPTDKYAVCEDEKEKENPESVITSPRETSASLFSQSRRQIAGTNVLSPSSKYASSQNIRRESMSAMSPPRLKASSVCSGIKSPFNTRKSKGTPIAKVKSPHVSQTKRNRSVPENVKIPSMIITARSPYREARPRSSMKKKKPQPTLVDSFKATPNDNEGQPECRQS